MHIVRGTFTIHVKCLELQAAADSFAVLRTQLRYYFRTLRRQGNCEAAVDCRRGLTLGLIVKRLLVYDYKRPFSREPGRMCTKQSAAPFAHCPPV